MTETLKPDSIHPLIHLAQKIWRDSLYPKKDEMSFVSGLGFQVWVRMINGCTGLEYEVQDPIKGRSYWKSDTGKHICGEVPSCVPYACEPIWTQGIDS